MGETGTKLRPTYAEQPEDPALADYWKETILLMDFIDATSQIADEALEAGGGSGNSLYETQLAVSQDGNTLAIDVVNIATASVLSRCSRLSSCALPALKLVLLWRWTLLGKVRGLREAGLSVSSRLRSPECSAAERKRLSSTASLVLDFVKRLVPYLNSLLPLQDRLRQLFAADYPVAAMLNDHGALLSAGHQRSAGSVLTTFPVREEDLTIPRDVEVVLTCAHLSRLEPLTGTRAAWYLVSSPGMGKTHFLEDLSMVLGALRDSRYAEAAARANLASWENIVSDLEGTRLCSVSFNGASVWGAQYEKFLTDVAADPNKALLPVYLRVLWCLRCAGRTWDWFVKQVHELLTVNPSLVDTIINEAGRALTEEPTIAAIEELNKVTPFTVRTAEASPAERMSGLTSTDPTESSAPRTASLTNVYRHEVCTWTRLEGVNVLLTAPFPGLVLAEVRKLMSKEQSAALDIEVAKLLRAAPASIKMQSLLLTSLSSRRKCDKPRIWV